jgi:RNA 2',3'-cyclic 3'-phosphodiesterase
VAGDEKLRLFCALRLDDETLDRVVAWQELELRGGRVVPRGNLHATLAFLGSQPAGSVAGIAGALRDAAGHASGIRFTLRGYRETRSVGMLTFDDDCGRGAALAERLFDGLEALGVYRREARPWLPHVTVLRFREHRGRHERPRLRPALPGLGEVVPSDAAVFISRLRPGGAQYDVLEAVALEL